MEFSLADVQTAAVFTGTQACLVNAPNPARMAVHKLILSGLRPISQRTKSHKDVQQAAMLYAWLRANDPQSLDFAEEDVQFADRKKFNELLEEATAKVKNLIASFQLGNVVVNGVKVAIVGKPNAGKSTLLNTLLNDERAIVSAIAGTTRDTVEETINIKGILFHFIDTAGIRNHTNDEIEQIGIRKSKEKIEQADIVIWLVDKDEAIENNEIKESLSHKNHLTVINKIDDQIIDIKNPEYFYISAKQKSGIEALTNALYSKVVQQEINTENTLVTNSRHLQHLQKIEQYLQSIQAGMHQNLSTDLIAPDIKLCLQQIGELTGTITNETVLDYVFSKFCIGK
mgnify:CR=1 FL=1